MNLLTPTALEIVLGSDHSVCISIMSNRLPARQQAHGLPPSKRLAREFALHQADLNVIWTDAARRCSAVGDGSDGRAEIDGSGRRRARPDRYPRPDARVSRFTRAL